MKNPPGKQLRVSETDKLLKKLEAAHATFMHEGRWIDWLSQSVPDAHEEYLQIISNLDEISERLKKKQKKGMQKSTIEFCLGRRGLN